MLVQEHQQADMDNEGMADTSATTLSLPDQAMAEGRGCMCSHWQMMLQECLYSCAVLGSHN